VLGFLSKIALESEISRVYFECNVCGVKQTILFDSGSPNTVITLALANSLGLKAHRSKVTKVYIAGSAIDVVPVTLPLLTMGSLSLTDVRVYAGLDKSWGTTVLLGLNVMNHIVYTVDRSEGSGFVQLELKNTNADFNRLISADGRYYITNPDSPLTPNPL